MWVSRQKEIYTTRLTGHINRNPHLVGRAPARLHFDFKPLELYGATARCSFLSFVNPLIVTPESEMIAKLLEQHVDDISRNFFILPSANSLKDFIKSYFSGSVATGLAYLAMENEGYYWGDHFENLGGGNPTHRRKPDFVFSGVATGIALMESKGSRSLSRPKLNETTEGGYKEQVEPHLGHLVGGSVATHGYAIGSWLTSKRKAELIIHHTEVPKPPTSSPSTSIISLATIQRNNFSTALSLVHSPQLGEDIRHGTNLCPGINFLRIRWQNYYWLMYVDLNIARFMNIERLFLRIKNRKSFIMQYSNYFFALEERIATKVFNNFLGKESSVTEFDIINPIDEELKLRVRGDSDSGGVVFSDGLAFIDGSKMKLTFQPTVWSREESRFL